MLLRRNSRKLGFLCDYIIGVFSPNVPKNMFVMLLSEPHSTDPRYKAIKVCGILKASILSSVVLKDKFGSLDKHGSFSVSNIRSLYFINDLLGVW